MESMRRMQKKSGFTLIELLVVVGVIALLASVLLINSNESGKQSRDVERQGDLRTLQSAIELYKHNKGRYPEGCNAVGSWSGQQVPGAGTYECAGGDTQYIKDLAPEFISALPIDPKPNGVNSGYVYRTNAAGTVYKLMAMNTVEVDTLHDEHEFRSCDYDVSQGGTSDILKAGWCVDTELPTPAGTTPVVCLPSDPRYQDSYAVWGGFAPLHHGLTYYSGLDDPAITSASDVKLAMRRAVADTTNVICQ